MSDTTGEVPEDSSDPYVQQIRGPINLYLKTLFGDLQRPLLADPTSIQVGLLTYLRMKELRAALEAAVKDVKGAEDKLMGWSLQYLQQSNQVNARFEIPGFGSRMLHTTTRESFNAEDPMALRDAVLADPANMIDLLPMRPTAEAVRAYAKTHNGELPPGVGVFAETKAHLRK